MDREDAPGLLGACKLYCPGRLACLWAGHGPVLQVGPKSRSLAQAQVRSVGGVSRACQELGIVAKPGGRWRLWAQRERGADGWGELPAPGVTVPPLPPQRSHRWSTADTCPGPAAGPQSTDRDHPTPRLNAAALGALAWLLSLEGCGRTGQSLRSPSCGPERPGPSPASGRGLYAPVLAGAKLQPWEGPRLRPSRF